MTYYKLSDKKPAVNTWIWMSYDGQKWQMAQMCKRGCCVHSNFGTMMLPTYWYPASDGEAQAEYASWQSAQSSDYFDFF